MQSDAAWMRLQIVSALTDLCRVACRVAVGTDGSDTVASSDRISADGDHQLVAWVLTRMLAAAEAPLLAGLACAALADLLAASDCAAGHAELQRQIMPQLREVVHRPGCPKTLQGGHQHAVCAMVSALQHTATNASDADAAAAVGTLAPMLPVALRCALDSTQEHPPCPLLGPFDGECMQVCALRRLATLARAVAVRPSCEPEAMESDCSPPSQPLLDCTVSLVDMLASRLFAHYCDDAAASFAAAVKQAESAGPAGETWDAGGSTDSCRIAAEACCGLQAALEAAQSLSLQPDGDCSLSDSQAAALGALACKLFGQLLRARAPVAAESVWHSLIGSGHELWQVG